MNVDVLTVLAPGEVVRPEALAALEQQGEVELRHYFAEGRRQRGESRSATVARARNVVKEQGDSDLALFMDRDVVLPAGGIARLVHALLADPACGALGITYQGPQPSPAEHVAMGAVLFRRAVLRQIRFRTEPGRCECFCCCEDVRRLG